MSGKNEIILKTVIALLQAASIYFDKPNIAKIDIESLVTNGHDTSGIQFRYDDVSNTATLDIQDCVFTLKVENLTLSENVVANGNVS